MTFDVAIVGAGIVGAACAASLASAGLCVVVIDASGVATGTTAAGMGHIVVMDDSAVQFALTNYSRGLWNDLAAELPATAEYEHCGAGWAHVRAAYAARQPSFCLIGKSSRFARRYFP